MSFRDILYLFISSFVALFPVMNPIGNGFIINGFLEGLDDAQRKSAIKKLTINALFVGLGSLLAGHLILLLFGLAIPVVEVGGGILICKTGWDWLSGESSTNKSKTHEGLVTDDVEKKLFYPIAFPITIGPGSISVIFTLVATASVRSSILTTGIHYTVIALVIVAMLVILNIFLSQGTRLIRKLGPSGNLIINKLIAFITFCIGIQILVTGLSKIFHLNIL
ncbi:MarC family protein [Paludibacteraceae bacterium OttesenSCG-928-F17]|nr:MarC family protein [Paludibacteraceae bacterium OttesenSCG-928-F17]